MEETQPPEINSHLIAPDVDIDYNRRACAAHNRLRRYHGAPPVGIDWLLANGAQQWAEVLNKEKKFEHSTSE